MSFVLIEIKIFNKILIFVVFAYIYFRSFFRLLFSHLLFHINRICFETFNFNDDVSRYLHVVNEFLCNVNRLKDIK